MSIQPTDQIVQFAAIEDLRNAIADLFQTSDTTLDYPEPGYVRFRGQFLKDPAECFDDLRARFERYGYTPKAQADSGRTALIAWPIVFRDTPSRRSINLMLFIATILSTLFVGAMYEAATPDEAFMIWRGWPFSLSIMLILGAHEMGHYLAARYHKVPVTEPYFIPMPLSIIGTFGAFIRLKAPVNNKRALLDVGASGPLAGLLFAIPILYLGLRTSVLGALPASGYILEGNSLLYIALKYLVYGQYLPANGIDVQLNQVAWAGWVGLLVTGLNLFPIGQLDGGHISFVLFGKRAQVFFWPVVITLIALVIINGAYNWIFWIVILIMFGRAYAEPLDMVTELDPWRKAIAIFTLCLFILVFVPLPLTQVGL